MGKGTTPEQAKPSGRLSGVVVGVVGPTTNRDDDACDVAFTMGCVLAAHDAVVVTGGHHREPQSDDPPVDPPTIHKTAKVQALLGAHSIGPAARTLGILGGRIHNEGETPPGARYVETTLGGARNLLTGTINDCLVAVPGGGGGTMSEIIFARAFERPVVFVAWTETQVREWLSRVNDVGEKMDKVLRSLDLEALFDGPRREQLPRELTNVDSLGQWLAGELKPGQCAFAASPDEAATLVASLNKSPNHGEDVLDRLRDQRPPWPETSAKLKQFLQELGLEFSGPV